MIEDINPTSDKPAAVRARRPSRLINATLLTGSIVLSLLLIELAFRAASGLPVFKMEDWRHDRVVFNRLGERGAIDPLVGWTLKPNHSSPGHNTLDHGIRRNGTETEIRTGHILATGDSFTEGWEVEDDDSWPAYLEGMLKTPIINAGVGGYGTDQIILRTEQLLPIIRPHTLIVGFLQFDIYRTGHSHFGAPKPWFTVENGALKYHPPEPVEKMPEPDAWARSKLAVRDALAYSAVAD